MTAGSEAETLYAATTAQTLLEQMLAKLHPLLAEGLYLASISDRFTPDLLRALRAREDGREAAMLQRLTQFSFFRLEAGNGEEAVYSLAETEREIIRRLFIAQRPDDYITAHMRALMYLRDHPPANTFVYDQSRLFHALIAEGPLAFADLERTFFGYTEERLLAAAERLLDAATAARVIVAELERPYLGELDDWLTYLTARLHQYRGRWAEGLQLLQTLVDKPQVPPAFRPFLLRAYGRSLAQAGDYDAAIRHYEQALHAFTAQPEQVAYTLLSVGDAYAALAGVARGYRQMAPLKMRPGWRWLQQWWPPALPLLGYVAYRFGWRFCRPRSWPALRDKDWVIVRLFSLGARAYRQADAILEQVGQPRERVTADEKLARLYLSMGDAAEARPVFERLLAAGAVSLSEYRRAVAQVGYGQTLLSLGEAAQAAQLVEVVLPILPRYDDMAELARAHAVLAEAYLAQQQPLAARPYFEAAQSLLHARPDYVEATELEERLTEPLTADEDMEADATQEALTNPAERHYPVRFQHPLLRFFRHLALLLLAVFLFTIPPLAISLRASNPLQPTISSFAAPLTENSATFNPTINNPELSQQLNVNLALAIQPDAEVAWVGGGILLLYLLLYTLAGLAIIGRVPPRTVQAAQQETVRLNGVGLEVGPPQQPRRMLWSEITEIITANTTVGHFLLPDSSQFTLRTPTARITIGGHTAWYAQLQQRVRRAAPQARHVRRDHDVLLSGWGGVYLAGFVLTFLYALWGAFSPATLFARSAAPYTLSDLYPYVLVLLCLPPLWWFVIRPTYLALRLGQARSMAVMTGAVAVALIVVRLFTYPSAWYSVPDVSAWLLIIVTSGACAIIVWYGRAENEAGAPAGRLFSTWTRLSVGLAAWVVLALALWLLGREVVGYHYLVRGHRARDAALVTPDAEARFLGLHQARIYYSWVLDYAADSGLTAQRNLGLPTRRDRLDAQAWQQRAAVQAQLGLYQEAVADYTQVLSVTGQLDYADRALAYQGWAATAATPERAAAARTAALEDLDRALLADPDNADYYLWRASARHAGGDLASALEDYDQAVARNPDLAQAWLGRGWILFAQANDSKKDQGPALLQEALTNFQRAVAIEGRGALPYPADGWLAVGYAHYGLQAYDQTLDAWSRALALAPNDPVMAVSRGTAYWLVGTPQGVDVCAESQEVHQIAQARRYLAQAVADLSRGIELAPDNKTTYRTRAQVHYLLRECAPGVYEMEMQAAIDDYQTALALDAQDAKNWERSARLRYALYLRLRDVPERAAEAAFALRQALMEVQTALTLAPDDPGIRYWYGVIQAAGLPLWVEAAEAALATADYTTALGQFQAVLEALPNASLSAFRAAVAALGLGDTLQAADLTVAGLSRSRDFTEADAGAETLADYWIAHPDQAIAAWLVAVERAAEHLATMQPEAAGASYHWHRARFAFTLGRILFERYPAGEMLAEELAQQAAAAVQEAAAQDVTVCRGNCTLWVNFLGDSLSGWYYMRRGDLRFQAGDYVGALGDYLAAAPRMQFDSQIEINDSLENAFKIGLAYLALGNEEQGEAAYAAALAQAETLGQEQQVDNSVTALRRLLTQSDPDLPDLLAPLLALRNR